MSKLSTVDQTATQIVESGESMTRNIWLAGLGMYSRSVEEAQSINQKTNRMFDELVERGKEVEQAAKDKIDLTRDKTADHLEDQMNDMMFRVSGIDRAKLDRLDEKIEKLTTIVEAMLEQQAKK